MRMDWTAGLVLQDGAPIRAVTLEYQRSAGRGWYRAWAQEGAASADRRLLMAQPGVRSYRSIS